MNTNPVTDLDILRLSDKEKAEFLSYERELIVKWIEREMNRAENSRKPIPHPLDFMMSTDEEKEKETRAVQEHNWHCDSVSNAYSYLLAAIEVGRKTLVNRMIKDKFPGNEYSI